MALNMLKLNTGKTEIILFGSKKQLAKVNIQSLDTAGTGELGYDRLNGTRKIGPSYAKSVLYI